MHFYHTCVNSNGQEGRGYVTLVLDIMFNCLNGEDG